MERRLILGFFNSIFLTMADRELGKLVIWIKIIQRLERTSVDIFYI